MTETQTKTEDCLIERRGAVALITMNRPDRLNAMGGQLVSLMREYLEEIKDDDDVLVVVLTGAGRGFCAGGDLKEQAPALGPSRIDGAQSLWRVPYLLHTMNKPTIAAVNGPAAGAGMALAMSCDMRIAARSARFVTAFRTVGLSGDFGGTYFLSKQIGYSRALELYLTSDHLDAQRALELGIVNHVVDDDRLLDKTVAFADWLAAGNPYVTARIKENFVTAADADVRTALQSESTNHRLCGREMAGDGFKAFREGRRPEPFSWEQ